MMGKPWLEVLGSIPGASPWVHMVAFLVREMGDEVLASIPCASPWVHTVALPTHEIGDEGWPPSP